jgi:hypothetical protein
MTTNPERGMEPVAWMYTQGDRSVVSLGRVTSERDAFWGWTETALYARRAPVGEMREALEPFANPPLYVFGDLDKKYVPAPMPADWIGGGWFNGHDFLRARAALRQKDTNNG